MIHQAFINQKGITGQSIEFNEDMTEQFNYYSYITDDLQPVPVLQQPLPTRKHQPTLTAHDSLQVNLLNNTNIGRSELFGFDVNKANGDWFHPLYMGGSGTPLIHSEAPSIANHQDEILVKGNITTNNTLTREGSFTSGTHVITLGDGTNSPSGIRLGAVITGTGVTHAVDANTITAIDFDAYTITVLYATTATATSELTIINIPHNTITNIGDGTNTDLVKVGARITGTGIAPDSFVSAKTTTTITMINSAGGAINPTQTLGTAGENVNGVGVYFNIWNEPNYYTQPVAQSATINIKKGI